MPYFGVSLKLYRDLFPPSESQSSRYHTMHHLVPELYMYFGDLFLIIMSVVSSSQVLSVLVEMTSSSPAILVSLSLPMPTIG
mmetsp:Transcript_36607/g.88722  ORF Transcript_36607/g.88722 Transcript_36607/m.88722 type:complete len:82 (+) Transcript_36607:389-634(+)